MVPELLDTIKTLLHVDSVTLSIITMFCIVGIIFMRSSIGGTFMAILYSPWLFIGSILSNKFCQEVQLTYPLAFDADYLSPEIVFIVSLATIAGMTLSSVFIIFFSQKFRQFI